MYTMLQVVLTAATLNQMSFEKIKMNSKQTN